MYDEVDVAQGPVALEYLSSCAVLTQPCPGSHWVYECHVVECSGVPRPVAVGPNAPKRHKKDAMQEAKAANILDVKVCDATGPGLVALWEEAADAYLAAATLLTPEQRARAVLRLENVRVSAPPKTMFNGANLTCIQTISSVDAAGVRRGTVVSFELSGRSPFMTAAAADDALSEKHCISAYSAWKVQLAKPPFRCSILGVVQNSQKMDTTLDGKPKKAFDLVDPGGAWVRCTAVGRNASSRALVDGTRVMIYFAAGRPSAGASPGAVFVLADSFIVPLAGAFPQLAKRMEISLCRAALPAAPSRGAGGQVVCLRDSARAWRPGD